MNNPVTLNSNVKDYHVLSVAFKRQLHKRYMFPVILNSDFTNQLFTNSEECRAN